MMVVDPSVAEQAQQQQQPPPTADVKLTVDVEGADDEEDDGVGEDLEDGEIESDDAEADEPPPDADVVSAEAPEPAEVVLVAAASPAQPPSPPSPSDNTVEPAAERPDAPAAVPEQQRTDVADGAAPPSPAATADGGADATADAAAAAAAAASAAKALAAAERTAMLEALTGIPVRAPAAVSCADARKRAIVLPKKRLTVGAMEGESECAILWYGSMSYNSPFVLIGAPQTTGWATWRTPLRRR